MREIRTTSIVHLTDCNIAVEVTKAGVGIGQIHEIFIADVSINASPEQLLMIADAIYQAHGGVTHDRFAARRVG